jgi:hypothetical protein
MDAANFHTSSPPPVGSSHHYAEATPPKSSSLDMETPNSLNRQLYNLSQALTNSRPVPLSQIMSLHTSYEVRGDFKSRSTKFRGVFLLIFHSRNNNNRVYTRPEKLMESENRPKSHGKSWKFKENLENAHLYYT